MFDKVDFWIIGAQKSGTTSLFNYISQHPDVFLPSTKEIHFFNDNEFWEQGESYLNSFYNEYKGEPVSGGAYVHTLYFEQNVSRLHQHNPDLKMIAVLRNPVERAYSAYWFARKNGWEEIESFEGAIEAEQSRLTGTQQERKELTYITHGHYAEQLERFYDYFPKDQIRIIFAEELQYDVAGVTKEIFRWLGVNNAYSADTSQRFNTSGVARFPLLHKYLLQDNSVKMYLRKITTPQQRNVIQKNLLLPLIKLNYKPFTYPAIEEKTFARLTEYYKSHNNRLSRLINKDVSNWG